MMPVRVVCSAPGSRRADYRSLFFPSVYDPQTPNWWEQQPERDTRFFYAALPCQRILLQGLAVTLPVCNGGVFVELQDDLPKNLSSSASSSD
ncbi:hypothetical protein CgunFtcFv8_027855 [Champsocephalus gunnari]|uniref:Uncharacterized protein n=1 Tax=Champsocephalus gunnari TaxID=52237 RepID=A0AAN8I1U1_CHAGU|nr:hypothetical protein CgunFtcFv8_027855 [Champsocephalus gunnari]